MEIQKRQYKVRPTVKQKTALGLLKASPTMKLAEAMRRSGYSEKSLLNPGRVLLRSRAAQQSQSEWLETLLAHGIHMQTLAAKYSKLLEAKKTLVVNKVTVEVDDNDIQFKVAESIKKDFGVIPERQNAEEKSFTFVWKKPITSTL